MDKKVHSAVADSGGIYRVPSGVEGYPPSNPRMDDNSQNQKKGGPEDNSRSRQVMIPGRILLPVDIARCPLEVFSYLNKFAGDHRVTVILLHVVNLNAIVPENRIFDALSCTAGQHLKRLSERFLHPDLTLRLRVRVGTPAQEILDEARTSNVDLIVLCSPGGSSFWKLPFQPGTVEKVLRAAHCNATLLRVRTRFNCEAEWNCADQITRPAREEASTPSRMFCFQHTGKSAILDE